MAGTLHCLSLIWDSTYGIQRKGLTNIGDPLAFITLKRCAFDTLGLMMKSCYTA